MRPAIRVAGLAVVVAMVLLEQPIATQSARGGTAAAAVNAFHAAVKSGNAVEVMRLIAPDALLIETGVIETRAEYEKNHLPANLEFEKAIPGLRGPSRVSVVGDAAWSVTTSEYKGTLRGSPIDLVGVELMVLSRDPFSGWRIRSVHWSGRPRHAGI